MWEGKNMNWALVSRTGNGCRTRAKVRPEHARQMTVVDAAARKAPEVGQVGTRDMRVKKEIESVSTRNSKNKAGESQCNSS